MNSTVASVKSFYVACSKNGFLLGYDIFFADDSNVQAQPSSTSSFNRDDAMVSKISNVFWFVLIYSTVQAVASIGDILRLIGSVGISAPTNCVLTKMRNIDEDDNMMMIWQISL